MLPRSIRRILVTGSSGTVGTRLCEQLTGAGYEVIGADYRPNRWNSDIDRLTIQVDLREGDKTQSCLPKDVDLVIHLAANARVHNLVIDPSLAMDNMVTTFNVLEHVRRNKIPRVMFASSREVYGNTDESFHAEGDANHAHCESPYTASKIQGEALFWAYHRCYGIETLIFRFSNVYGMYDESDRVVPLFIKKCLLGEEIKIFGKDKVLDFTYIDDTIRGVMLAIERFSGAKNQVYNLASGKGVSMVELAEIIQQAIPSESKVVVYENRPGELMKYVADINRARTVLDYKPKVFIQEGVQKSIEWYTQHLYADLQRQL